MTPAATDLRSRWNFRLGLICLTAASVSLPMAWISLAKIFLFLASLGYLIGGIVNHRSDKAFCTLWTPRLVLVILAAFAISLAWTEVDQKFALEVFVKHGKLLEIVLIISLIHTLREARLAISVFAYFQAFVLINSWTLATGITLPWVTDQADQANTYVVFAESYIDQSIMFAIVAAILWHLREDRLWPRYLAIFLAIMALLNVFVLLPGRTGYVVALVIVTLAVFWGISKNLRLPIIILTPLLLVGSLYFGSEQAQHRINKILQESQNYAQHSQTDSSSGWRLNAWHRSLQAIQEKPLIGHGVGSWTPAVKRFEGTSAIKAFGLGNFSNPHQEYLLWGVELGITGLLLLLFFLICVVLDARHFPTGPRRAVLSVLAATAVACLFNSALFDDLLGDFLCVALGLTMALGVQSLNTAKDFS